MAVRVLVADDSIFIRGIIRHHLELLGCEVVGEAENGAQAVDLFKTLRPQLVTLDVVMPQVNGIDSISAFRLMRAEDPKVPILVFSAVPFAETRKAFLDEGALDYINKPFDKESFDKVRMRLQASFPELKKSRVCEKLASTAKGA